MRASRSKSRQTLRVLSHSVTWACLPRTGVGHARARQATLSLSISSQHVSGFDSAAVLARDAVRDTVRDTVHPSSLTRPSQWGRTQTSTDGGLF